MRRFVWTAIAILLTMAIISTYWFFIASLLQTITISTINFSTFSELAFSFSLSPAIILESMAFAIMMGFLGGFLPAVRAARQNIIEAIRAV